LKIGVPDPKEIAFRTCLLRRAADELPRLPVVHVTRLYEAACGVGYPSEEVTQFRHACQPALASIHGLAPYKDGLPAKPKRTA
jgi:hypothetical protein